MRIYTNDDGSLYVNAITTTSDGVNVDGHAYVLVAGARNQEIGFQLGPVAEAGVNGFQNEQLIAVLVHRLGVLNKAFPCRENSLAITKLEEALLWLEKRTADRKARGVEGTNQA
jgi:hypothetical protein